MSETIPPTRRSAQDFETAVDSADRRVAAFDPHRRGPVEKLQHVLHSNPTLVPVIVLLGAVAVFGVVSGSKFFSTVLSGLRKGDSGILKTVDAIGLTAQNIQSCFPVSEVLKA